MINSDTILDVPESVLFSVMRQRAERDEIQGRSETRQEVFTSLYGDGDLDPVVRIARTWSDI
jgi:hypothetical protein